MVQGGGAAPAIKAADVEPADADADAPEVEEEAAGPEVEEEAPEDAQGPGDAARGDDAEPAAENAADRAACPTPSPLGEAAVQRSAAAACSACNGALKWSRSTAGAYATGWKCDNFQACSQSSEDNAWRWHCASCEVDLCGECCTAVPCKDCNHALTWSEDQEGPYALGWRCDECSDEFSTDVSG